MPPPDDGDDEDDDLPPGPRITAVHWRTPESAASRVPFTGICPWCGGTAEHGAPGVSQGRRCSGCDAMAWGAPAADYDEVVDDALNHFRIDSAQVGGERYEFGAAFWAKAGIDVLEGGCGGEHSPMSLIFWYWFRRSPAIN